MKAIGVTICGGPEVLHVVELPDPHAGAGEGAHARPRHVRQSRIASSICCPCFCNGYGFLLFQKRGNDRPGSWAAPRILERERAPTILVRLLREDMKEERRHME